MKAVQIVAFGKPTEVLQVADVPDVGAPGPNEVVIALEASPINPSDLFMFTGNYGYRPPLPSIVGAEGAGRVVAVGPGKLRDTGDRSALAVSKGDEVIYGRYAGNDITMDRKEIKILRESDILAKVVK